MNVPEKRDLMEFIIGIIAIICALYVIINVWGSGESGLVKIVWTIAAIFFSIITAIVYYFIGPKRA